MPTRSDLFRPVEYGYEFKVVVTNRRTEPRGTIAFREGRGAQEVVPAEPETHCRMDYVPVGTPAGDRLHMFAGIPSRNPTREPQTRPASAPAA